MQDVGIAVVAHLLEFLVTFLFCNDIFQQRIKKRYAVSIGIFLFALEFVLFLTLQSTVVNIISNLIITFLFVLICYRSRWVNALLAAMFLASALTASEYLVMIVEAAGTGGDINTFSSGSFVLLLSVVISRTVFFVFTKIVVFAGLYLQGGRNTRFPFFLLLYPAVTIIILYTFWVITSRYELSRGINIAIAIASLAVFLSIYLTFVFYSRTSKKLDELHNAQREANRIQTDQTYYALLDSQNETLKQITHDEKNHLAAIKSLANNPEVNAYIDSVFGEIQFHSMFGNTQNRYLDLLLNKYQSVCDTKGVDLAYSIKTANLSFMEAPDLITLISNILDNAVEAAGQSTEKSIDLSINRANGFDVLSCSNSCDVKPISNGKTLSSTKKEKGFHGFGMKSIKRIAEKYHGEIDWFYRENKKEFVINIAFFMED